MAKPTDRPPEEWKSAGEPMTDSQASFLKRLSTDAGEEFDATLSKAAASRRIDELLNRGKGGSVGDRRAICLTRSSPIRRAPSSFVRSGSKSPPSSSASSFRYVDCASLMPPSRVTFGGRDAGAFRVRFAGAEAADPPAFPRFRSSSIRRDAAALLKVASNSSPASVERRLRNDACESVIGSPALFHSSGGRSRGFGTDYRRAAGMPALRCTKDQRGVMSAEAH